MGESPQRRGIFVVSLDFELHWGIRDHTPLSLAKEALAGVRPAVEAMLELFQEHQIHATWATVGMLFARGREDLQQYLPGEFPSYHNARLSPYGELASCGESESEDPYHFAADVLGRIRAIPGQEIGTHTFSHFYCLEAGQTEGQFDADLSAVTRIADSRGLSCRSLVFPRNQVNASYLTLLPRHGIRAYRSNASTRATLRPGALPTLLRRATRLVDAYAPIDGAHTFSLERTKANPVPVPASMFLRPYSPRFRQLDPLRVRRVKAAMTRAALRGEGFHLWWHPHNFGTHLAENVRILKKILQHFSALRVQAGMASCSMLETAAVLHPEVAASSGDRAGAIR